MSKISDELRERGNGYFEQRNGDCEWFNAIADRIDREMVELPKSADGKIWTGREVCFWTDAEQEGWHSFGCVALRCGKWYVEDTDGMEFAAGSVWSERPDSFERIANELDEMADSETTEDDMCEKLADIADRIRKLAEKEG